MISSLVNLKDSSLGEAVDLSDIKHQINAIEIIHDKLTNMDDISQVNLRDYLLDILNRIFADYSVLTVHLEEEIEEVIMPAKKSVPLGLIANEVATNAVKYGFTQEEAVFSVSFRRDGEAQQYVLVLSNTGAPFPEEIDFDTADSLGLRLIQALVRQLDGTVELRKTPHPVFTIRFPAE
jgi:two-component sensor histidine kinase